MSWGGGGAEAILVTLSRIQRWLRACRTAPTPSAVPVGALWFVGGGEPREHLQFSKGYGTLQSWVGACVPGGGTLVRV